MSVPKSKEDYIELLKQRRDVTLPKEIANILERKQKLETEHQKLLKEQTDLQREINFWSGNGATNEKIVFDIPHDVWAHMQTMFRSYEEFPRNLSLASETLMELVSGNSLRNKVKHLGVQVFAVLARNGYIDRDDFLSCFNSNSKELSRFAAISWCHLKHNVAAPIVELLSSPDILEFMKTLDGKTNLWEVFGGKCFRFNVYQDDDRAARKSYIETLKLFLRLYGKFILSVDAPRIQLMHKNIFEYIPEIQYVSAFFGHIDTLFLIVVSDSKDCNRANFNVFYELKLDFLLNDFDFVMEQMYQKWSMKFTNLQKYSWQNHIFRNVKELLLDTDGSLRPINYKNTLAGEYPCFRNVTKLSIHFGLNELGTLYVLNKFPNVSEISITKREFMDGFGAIRITENIDPPGPMRFPQITKFTLEMELTNDFLLSLDRVFEMFPSLRNFALKCCYNKETLRTQIRTQTANENFAMGQTIDLFLLYSEGSSLKDSNIWRLERNLKKIVIESVMEFGEWEHFPGQGVKRRPAKLQKEVYYRNWNGEVSFHENIVLL